MRAPLAAPAAALVSGIALGANGFVPLGLCLGALAVLCGTSLLTYWRRNVTIFLWATALAFAAGGAILGAEAEAKIRRPALLALFDHNLSLRAARQEPVVIEGTLREDAAPTSYGASLIVDVTSVGNPPVMEPTAGGVRLAVAGSLVSDAMSQWSAGRHIRAPVLLRRPLPYLNPGVPDQTAALARRGIVLLGSVKSAALIEVVTAGGWIAERAAAARGAVRTAINRSVGQIDPRSAAIVIAILIGDRAGLDDETLRRLQEAGTYHVLAISGGNIAIAASLLLLALRWGGVSGRRAAAVAALALGAYAVVVGSGASVMRATLVAEAYFCARMLDHRTQGLNAVALAALLLSVVQPLDVFDIGFIFTFAATVAILLGVPELIHRARARLSASPVTVRWLLPAVAIGAATISVEMVLWPISAVVFSRVSLAGLVLNFAAIPLMSVVQVAGAAACVLAVGGETATRMPAYIAHGAAWALTESARLVDVAPWLVVRMPPPPLWLVAGYYLACAVAYRAPAGSRSRRAALAGVLGSVMVMVAPIGPAREPGVLRVTVFDVGQGDATLIEFPEGGAMLVDAAGAAGGFDLGGRIVAPALWARGVRRLDRFVITHGDPDHLGGGLTILRDFRTDEVWEGVPVPPHEALRLLRAAAEKRGSRWRQVRTGDRFTMGGLVVRVLHPPPPDWERQQVRNDDSIVLELRYRDVSVVLPGDIGRDVEPLVAAALEPAPWRLVKVPHHGSGGSSSPAFVAAARAQAVIFSAGRGNRYGHPVPSVLARYQRTRAAVFRTDEEGAVTLTTDGHRVQISTMTGRRVEYEVGASGEG